MSTRERHRARGFTMIELIIALAIVLVLLAVAAPALLQSRPQDRIRETVKEFVADVRLARSWAVGGESQSATLNGLDYVEVQVDATANTYSIVGFEIGPPLKSAVFKNVDLRKVPGATITVSPTSTIRFTGNGENTTGPNDIEFREATMDELRKVQVTRSGIARSN